jgi:hypothetical protein
VFHRKTADLIRLFIAKNTGMSLDPHQLNNDSGTTSFQQKLCNGLTNTDNFLLVQ